MNEGLEKVHDLTKMPISLTHLVNEHKYKRSTSPRYFVLKSAPTGYTIFEFKN